jgi:hypothetical protein
MRWIAALLTCVAAVLASNAALAADESRQALFGAAFSNSLAFRTAADVSSPGLGPAARYAPGLGLIRWTGGEVASFGRDGVAHVDSLRLSTASLDPVPGTTLLRPDAAGVIAGPRAYDLTYVRNWPAMVSVTAGRVSLDITPHAGVGVSTGGVQSAEAGALVRLGEAVQDRVLQAMGMGGAGDHPRWYLYAGASGRAVGLNLVRSEDGVRRDNVAGEGFVRQAQAGVGVSRGALHALLGYTREQVTMRALGPLSRDDERVGLTLQVR